jgi:dTDP-4-dehydrorhamnose reductase
MELHRGLLVRIAVVGARGQLAAAVAHECAAGHEVIALTHEDLDAADDAAVASAMDRARPDVIVNGAAFTDVDGAEDRPVDALNANAFAVRALARAADRHGAALVHYSTDFVFDGTASAPYTEEDRPNPRSVYAATKLLGEWFALDRPRAYVLRVEALFGTAPEARPAKGSVAGILNTVRAGGTPKVFVDRTITPTFVLDAARATRRLLESSAPGGVYHCVNSGICTWLEFAQELARQIGVEPRFEPVRLADVHFRAARPLYCALSNEKLRSAGIDMPLWQDALRRYLASEAGANVRVGSSGDA